MLKSGHLQMPIQYTWMSRGPCFNIHFVETAAVEHDVLVCCCGKWSVFFFFFISPKSPVGSTSRYWATVLFQTFFFCKDNKLSPSSPHSPPSPPRPLSHPIFQFSPSPPLLHTTIQTKAFFSPTLKPASIFVLSQSLNLKQLHNCLASSLHNSESDQEWSTRGTVCACV